MVKKEKAKEVKKNNTQLSKIILNSVGILDIYTSDFKLKIHGRELAKMIKEQQKTVSNKLKILSENGILKKENKGSLKNYSLNLANPLVLNLMTIAEENKAFRFISGSFLFSDLFKKIIELTNEEVIVFGSYARGDFTKESDLDILILDKPNKKIEEAIKLYPKKTHIMYMDKKTFEKGLFKKENFMLELLKNHIIIKGSSSLVHMFKRYYHG